MKPFTLLVFLVACDADLRVGRDHPPVLPDAAVADALPDVPVGPQPDCVTDNTFDLLGPGPTDHVHQVTTATFFESPSDVVGFHGRASGTPAYYSFRRDGDVGDGNLGEMRTYDVGQYPYHLTLGIAAADHTGCDSGCTTEWIATQGVYTVTELAPVYRATFMLTEIREGSDPAGTIIPGTVIGCLRVSH